MIKTRERGNGDEMFPVHRLLAAAASCCSLLVSSAISRSSLMTCYKNTAQVNTKQQDTNEQSDEVTYDERFRMDALLD